MPWFEEPLLDTCWKALLRAPTNVQLHGGVDPVDPLVIPAVTSPTQPIERLPEAYPRLLLNEFRERRNDIAVVTFTPLVAIGARSEERRVGKECRTREWP